MQLLLVIIVTYHNIYFLQDITMNHTSTRYTKTAIVLHGLIALGVIVMFALGWYMSEIPKEAAKQTAFDLFDLLMIAVPVSGLIMAINSKYGVMWFGFDFIAGLDNKNLRELFNEVHEIVGVIFLAF